MKILTFNSAQAAGLAEQFVRLPAGEDALFCLWGHGYELVAPEDWEKTERLCGCVPVRKVPAPADVSGKPIPMKRWVVFGKGTVSLRQYVYTQPPSLRKF